MEKSLLTPSTSTSRNHSSSKCASYLSLQDLSNIAMTCKYSKTVAYSDYIWLPRFRLESSSTSLQTSGVREAYLARRRALRQFNFIDPFGIDITVEAKPFDHLLMDKIYPQCSRFSGSQKAFQLAALCLSRDPKARPLMREVVEVLIPVPEMKDMASSSSSYFQALQAERAAAAVNARIGSRSGARFSRNAQPNRSLFAVNGPNGSPYQLKHRQWSHHAQPNRSLSASNGLNGSPYQRNHRQRSPTAQPKRSLSTSNGPKG